MPIKILIVDDESDLEFLINAKFKKAIKDGEFEFHFALNGAEALKLLDADPNLNIILTDLNMPIMDGLTLLQKLPGLKRTYKAVVVSAYGDISNIRSAMNSGASDFIMKPINFDDFKATIVKMVDEYKTLNTAILAETNLKQIKMELEIAKSIQESLLPPNFMPFQDREIDLAGRMIPAALVGGDFFDFFPMGKHKLALVIADVSGKNISACLYMAITRSLIKAFSNEFTSSQDIIQKVDHYLSADNSYCMFVTTFYATLDVETGYLCCCNAGHNKPLILHKDGSITNIPLKASRPLGVENEVNSSDTNFEEINLQLGPGDCLFLYTDGVTDAQNIEGEMYGEQRLKNILSKQCKEKCPTLVKEVVNDIQIFSSGAIQYDDITMLAIRPRP